MDEFVYSNQNQPKPKKNRVILIIIIFSVILLTFFSLIKIFPDLFNNKVRNTSNNKLNYSITYKNNNDQTGRTFLTSRKVYDEKEEFGWNVKAYKGKKYYEYGIGIYKKREQLTGSKDFYIFLENPKTKEEIKALVWADPSRLNKSIGKANAQNSSRLAIDNLTASGKDEGKVVPETLGYLTENKLNWDNLIHEGDILMIVPWINDKGDPYFVNGNENKIPIAAMIIIRRNGGEKNL